MSPLSWITLVFISAGTYVLFYIVPSLFPSRKLRHVPTVGCRSDSVIDYWIGVFKFFSNALDTVQEGYKKFEGRPFKVPTVSGWVVVVSDDRLVQEMKTAKDDSLSMSAAVEDTMQLKYTLGSSLPANPYHIGVVRTPLTRNMQYYYPAIRDEIVTAFSEEIPIPDDNEWHQIPILNNIMRIVCRASNRLFVGLPSCRDPEFIKLTTEFAINVIKTAIVVNMFPRFLRPLVGPIIGPLPSSLKKARKLLGPTIEFRLSQLHQHGKDWEGKPNDLISWLIDYGTQSNQPVDVENIVLRVLTINFAAIHTTSMAFADALFDLAARPKYIEPLREEIQRVVDAEGWSKGSIGKLKKLDSFVKESQRMSGTSAIGMLRKALKDVSFSDGTAIPAGSVVGIAALARQSDGNIYPNPTEFDGFRFSDLRDLEGESTKHHCVSPDSSYFVFGMGRHACPGRFLAILEVKNLLAHTILNYDIKFEDNQRPKNTWAFQNSQPSASTMISMKRRQKTEGLKN